MTVKQVLKLSVMFLGKDELLSCPYFAGGDGEISEKDQKELSLLQRCLNLVVSEISTDYLPIYKTKKIAFSNQECNIVNVDSNIYQIIKIINNKNFEIGFKVFGDKIVANTTNAEITYTSFAPTCNLDSNIETFSNKVSERVFAYGVAMEYSFISSLYEDASVWESRYKNALFSITHKKNNIIMPKRRWL